MEPSYEHIEAFVEDSEAGGAVAISVLVEPIGFNGSFHTLQRIVDRTSLPILAKGFHFSPTHLACCKAYGATGYLHMIKVFNTVGSSHTELIDLGQTLDIESFVEANSTAEIEQAIALGSKLMGINNRRIYDDLGTDLSRASLGKDLPTEAAFISLSGIEGPDDIRTVYENSNSRVDAVLVGTSVMKAKDRRQHIERLVRAGKEVVK